MKECEKEGLDNVNQLIISLERDNERESRFQQVSEKDRKDRGSVNGFKYANMECRQRENERERLSSDRLKRERR